MQSQLEELTFMFQPIAALPGSALSADGEPSLHSGWSEALIRWNLPDGTIRGPLDILPYWLAPSRIEAFTRHTLLLAARKLARNPGVRLSVNLTRAQLLLPATLCLLNGMVRGVTERLYIEVVEEEEPCSAELAKQMRLLREACGGIYLDDVTHSDLNGRLRFGAPADGVKIDRTVIHTALYDTGPAGATARTFISDAGRRFPVVVAEGIEDVAACEELRALGASHVQGFGIARPAAELRTTLVEVAPTGISTGALVFTGASPSVDASSGTSS